MLLTLPRTPRKMVNFGGPTVEWQITLERITKNKPNFAISSRQLKQLANQAGRYGFAGKAKKLSEPEPFVEDGQPGYKTTGRIRIERITQGDPGEAHREFKALEENIRSKAKEKYWQIVDTKQLNELGELAPVQELVPRSELNLPSFDDSFAEAFSGIYERESHVRIIYKSLENFLKTNGRRRSHVLLYGKPAAAKTTVFERMKQWLEGPEVDGKPPTERVALLDATTLTKAGLEHWILNRASTNTLPEVLCLEEVEKHNPDNLLCLLSVMDGRGIIQRTNARIGHQQAKTKMVVWGTCNNETALMNFHRGALWSRFTHRLYCPRPTRELMKKILLGEIEKIPQGDPRWADAILKFVYDERREDDPDPRSMIGLLDGGEHLLDESYQKDILETLPPKKSPQTEE